MTDQENQIPIAGDVVSPMDGVMDMPKGNPGEDSNRHSGDLGLIEKASTRDCGLQVVLTPQRRSKAVLVTPMRADAACSTDPQQLSSATTENMDLSWTSDSCYLDDDHTRDYVPSGSTSSSEDEETARALSLKKARKMIMKNTTGYLGLAKGHCYIIDLICEQLSYHNRGQTLSTRDEVLLVLMVIRTGTLNYIIADMFGVSKSCVSRILAQVVPVMAGCLKELVYWPPSDVIRSRLPLAFKAYYSDVESIIDCFEIQIEKSSSAMTQSMTWSEYKKCNSVKYLISVTPAGLINFISCGRPGRCSDIELLRGSEYLACLKPGMSVLADRGFKEVEGDLVAKGCHLTRPASVAKDQKLPAKEVSRMKVIAGLRIHVERVIRRVRVFKILEMHSCVPL
ncbi:hypothetical protein Pcinc_023312 [Petrolisthes cinctipes]|uniref:DDE Tnp4 domain-containing protein n=1 Tax=Petrolisthes cinctipes TaxID=88211 RepID=A0AAE1FD87_PETCI|nr:hypothetical protein Pcinc_023312 [Petrolisthes cinctipes]